MTLRQINPIQHLAKKYLQLDLPPLEDVFNLVRDCVRPVGQQTFRYEFYGLRAVSLAQKYELGGEPIKTQVWREALLTGEEETYAAAVQLVALDQVGDPHPALERHLRCAVRCLREYALVEADSSDTYRVLLLGSPSAVSLGKDFEIGMLDARILGAWEVKL